MAKTKIAKVPVFTVLAKTANLVGRAGAIPFMWSEERGELEAKQTWKSLTILKQSVLILQILFMLYQSCYFAMAKDIPLFQSIYVIYTTLGICISGDNLYVVYRDPGAMRALVNSLTRSSRRFYGIPFFSNLQY